MNLLTYILFMEAGISYYLPYTNFPLLLKLKLIKEQWLHIKKLTNLFISFLLEKIARDNKNGLQICFKPPVKNYFCLYNISER